MIAVPDPNAVLELPILIGDIGGTNARFAIIADAYAEAREFPVVPTASFNTINEAIQSVLDQTHLIPRSALIAVAGPLNGDEVDMTNSDWVVRPREMIADFGFVDVIVLNDFEAQALAVVALGEEHLEKIGGGAATTVGSRVVLGPGTGLGVSGLLNARRAWITVPGEGGHVDLGPRTDREYEIFKHVRKIGGRVSAEQILCGPGIVNLYQAIAALEGKEPIFTNPEEISAAALEKSDALAIETFELFVTFLGRMAGDLALIFSSRGGVYLAGGIAKQILPLLTDGRLRAAFEDKAPHERLLKEIPIYVITQNLAALAGLAAYARTPSRFNVRTTGRRWRASNG